MKVLYVGLDKAMNPDKEFHYFGKVCEVEPTSETLYYCEGTLLDKLNCINVDNVSENVLQFITDMIFLLDHYKHNYEHLKRIIENNILSPKDTEIRKTWAKYKEL